MGLLSLERHQLPMQLPLILIFRAGNMHNAPDFLLTLIVTHQHGQQFSNIQPVRLRPSFTSVDFDAGRIYYQVGYSQGQQVAVQPKAVSPSLVTAEYRRSLWQSKPFLGHADFLCQCRQIPGFQVALSRCLPKPDGEPKLPLFVAEFDCHVKVLRLWCIIDAVGCFRFHTSSFRRFD